MSAPRANGTTLCWEVTFRLQREQLYILDDTKHYRSDLLHKLVRNNLSWMVWYYIVVPQNRNGKSPWITTLASYAPGCRSTAVEEQYHRLLRVYCNKSFSSIFWGVLDDNSSTIFWKPVLSCIKKKSFIVCASSICSLSKLTFHAGTIPSYCSFCSPAQ